MEWALVVQEVNSRTKKRMKLTISYSKLDPSTCARHTELEKLVLTLLTN
jgi:hypothetical protein